MIRELAVRWRRWLLLPAGATATIATAGVIAVTGGASGTALAPAGFVLAWLLLGLTAGYALSGSA